MSWQELVDPSIPYFAKCPPSCTVIHFTFYIVQDVHEVHPPQPKGSYPLEFKGCPWWFPPQPKGSYPLEVKDAHDISPPSTFRVADDPFLGPQMTRTYGKVWGHRWPVNLSEALQEMCDQMVDLGRASTTMPSLQPEVGHQPLIRTEQSTVIQMSSGHNFWPAIGWLAVCWESSISL